MSGPMRLLRFNAVAMMGMSVQLAVVGILTAALSVDATVASASGVVAAVAHNFAWHVRWTWRDRLGPGTRLAAAFGRFAGANGAVSLLGTIALMPVLTGIVNLPPITANIVAIGICGGLNFVLADRLAFRG